MERKRDSSSRHLSDGWASQLFIHPVSYRGAMFPALVIALILEVCKWFIVVKNEAGNALGICVVFSHLWGDLSAKR